METMRPFIQRGDYIEAEWFDAKIVGLAGVQMKLGATQHVAKGIVVSVRGDHPTNPTEVRLFVRQEDGETVAVNPDHVKVYKGDRLPQWPHFDVWRDIAIEMGFVKREVAYRENDLPKPPVGTCSTCGAPPGQKCDAGLH